MTRLAALALTLCAGPAAAHPHLFIDAGLTLVYEGDRLTAVEVVWEYDEFSSMLMVEDHGLDPDRDGTPEADRLAAFAGHDVDWAAGFPGDLKIEAAGEALALGPAGEFAMDWRDGRIISRHTRPVLGAARGPITARVFDPGFFVAYTVSLPITVSGREGCEITQVPADLDAAYTLVEELLYGPRSEQFNEDNYPEVGIHFADTIKVACAGSS